MSIELKPCPFCGGEASLYGGTNFESGRSAYYVECSEPLCPVCPTTPTADLIAYKTEAKAVEAWNTRAEPRTCRIVKKWSDSDFVDGWRYRCSECMAFIPVNERDPETGDVISAANFCPNCGAKVVVE